MNGSDRLQAYFREWLQNDRVQYALQRAAARILRSRCGYGRSVAPDEVDELVAEINLHLLEKYAAQGGASPPAALSHPESAAAYLHSTVLNLLRERERRTNPRKRLYRRLREVLNAADTFRTSRLEGGAMAYSLATQPGPVAHVCEEDLEQVRFPASLPMHIEAFNRRPVLLEAAAFFWHQIADTWQCQTIRLPVWSLVEWIARSVPLHATITDAAGDPEHTAAREDGNGLARVADTSRTLTIDLWDKERLAHWATVFAARLSDREAAVAWMRLEDPPLAFARIAERTGFRSASGPKQAFERVCERMRSFLADKEELSPDVDGDVNEAAFAYFVDTLAAVLKMRPPMPSKQTDR